MKLGGESRIHLETHEAMAITSTRNTITFGTWSVRTMFEAGKTAQVPAEIRNYNLTVLRISGTRWTGSGPQRLATEELLLHSDHEDNAPHTQGVTLMLSKATQREFTGLEAHRPRILKATFQIKKRMINVGVIPTNDSNEDVFTKNI